MILALAWFGGLIRPQNEQDSGPTSSLDLTASSSAVPTPSSDEVEVIEQEEDISLEKIEPDTSEVISVEDEVLPSTIEVFEAPEPADVSPSGRLASLRSEDVEPSEPLEDRMDRFFGN